MKKTLNAIRIGLFVGLAFLFACGSSPKDKKRQELRGRIDQIQEILSKRSAEAIYGSPQMLQEREEQNKRCSFNLDLRPFRYRFFGCML